MDGTRFDLMSKSLAGRTNRRALIGRGGAFAVAAGLAGSIGRRAVRAQESTPAPRPEVPADAPAVIPFHAAVRQGPSAGTEFLGYLALQVAGDGDTSGAFVTESGDVMTVVGTLAGHAANLMFTPAGGADPIFGTGTSAANLSQAHGPVYTAMGGPLVGPAEGDLGDWAVVTNYDQILIDGVTVSPGTIGAAAKTKRSPMCRACVQGCKQPGITDVDLCSGFCGSLFGGPCGCDEPGFEGTCI